MPRKAKIVHPRRQPRPRREQPRQQRPRRVSEPAPARARAPRQRASPSSDKIRTTRVSNEPRGPISSGNAVKDSQKAAVGVLDPFASFAHGYKTGLPFAAATAPAFGFWTRYVKQMVEIPFGAAPGAPVGARATIFPWVNPAIQIVTALNASGFPTAALNSSDPQLPFVIPNFESIVVAYQGLRVRNLTPVLSQGGTTVIGNASFLDATSNTFDQLRANANSMTHANGDPGVIAQATYFGNPANEPVAGTFVVDYQFCPVSNTLIDGETRCITFASFGIAAAPQTFELEVVTYYLAIPFATPSQIFQSVRYDVEAGMVNRLLDRAYNASPLYCIPRNFIKDDGWDVLWTGAKSIITDIGLGLLGTLASAVGSAFSSLFVRNKLGAYYRLLTMLPPDEYSAFRDLLDSHATHAEAVATLSRPPPVVLTRNEILRLTAFLADTESPVSIDVPASAVGGSAKQSWFGRK